MNLTLKPVTECPAFSRYHNDVWNAELKFLQPTSGQTCDETIPCGLYDLTVPTVFGEKNFDLEINNVVMIGENKTIFAWMTEMTGENSGKIALEVL